MFREKFKVQMWRLLFVVVYTICFSISVSATQQTAIYNVESYSDILDIRCTPYSNDYFTGGFSDLGSWMCFTLPSENNWINGFCGPFELDHRQWISDAILQVGFTADITTETFTPDSVTYVPGELYMNSSSQQGNIQQRLFFVDKYTALWSCETSEKRELYITNGSLQGIQSSGLENNILSLKLSTGTDVCRHIFIGYSAFL